MSPAAIKLAKSFLAGTIFPAALAILGALAIVRWMNVAPAVPIEERTPGLDGAPAVTARAAAVRPTPGDPIRGAGVPSRIAAGWPCFRGADRDGINKETIRLARQWPASGPKRLWSVSLGEGYASAAVAGGCVYVLDHVHDSSADLLHGLSADDCRALAEALSAVSPADAKRLDAVLPRFFPREGNASGGAATVTASEFEDLKQAVREHLTVRRDALLLALRNNSIDDIDRSADTMRCLSLDDGREIWRNGYRIVLASNHGISRTIPVVAGNVVVSIGPKCQVAGWDAQTGKALWLIDLVLDYGASVPPWYTGQCPWIDRASNRLIVAPGGKCLAMAIDFHTGKVLWETPNPHRWAMTHVSIVPMQVDGRRMYVYCGKGGVAGIDADSGKILWDTTDWQISMATCPSPVDIGDGRVFLCGGYNAGAMMLQVTPDHDAFAVQKVYQLAPRQFSSEQQTPVLWRGNLYGVRQKDQRLVCLDLDGRERWTSGSERFGSGPYIIADGKILAMNDDGVLTLAEATPTGYHRMARAQVIDEGSSSWGPLALAAGRLIVRDMKQMVCLDVAEAAP
jgi:outer membrane protein assembly factor BamB